MIGSSSPSSIQFSFGSNPQSQIISIYLHLSSQLSQSPPQAQKQSIPFHQFVMAKRPIRVLKIVMAYQK